MFHIFLLTLFLGSNYISAVDDENCLPGSLDQVNLPVLLAVAVNNSVCYTEARNAFNLTYRKANFYIDSQSSGGIYEYKKRTVRLGSFETVETTLKLFGDLIQFIDISFDGHNETSAKELIGLINENCTETLTQLHLKNCDAIALNEFKKPFSKVKKSTFSSHSNFQSKTDNQLDRLFPRLTWLNVKIVNLSDWKLIGGEFPYLRNLIIENKLPEPIDSAYLDVGSLFKGSPNINSLCINYISLNALKAASDFLPNLKILRVLDDISNEPYNGDQIRFSNVTQLVVISKNNNPQIPEKMIFNQLHELFLTISGDYTDEWIEFFKNQQNKTIYICELSFSNLTNQQLIAIADSQPNIKFANVYIHNASNLSVDAIISFIKKSEKLIFIIFSGVSFNVAERKMLQEKLAHEWAISGAEFDSKSMSLFRS